ncbi:MAG: glycosyltransferase [Sphingobium sp.]
MRDKPGMGQRRPRVLYLINGFKRGGAEKGVLHLLQHGAFAGCDVRLLSIIADEQGYVEELRSHGATVAHLFSSKSMSIWQWILAIPGFWWAMVRMKPDLVILSLPQANIAGRIATLFCPRLTIASFEHNTHLAKRIYESLFRWTSRRVDWLLADCEATAQAVGSRLYARQPERMIALPLTSFEGAAIRTPPTRDEARPFTIVSAARFTSVKNQAAMIEAVRILREQDRAVQLHLYGEGPLLDRCKQLASHHGLNDRVLFPGFNARWMKAPADIFLVTSEHEGLCIAALEAMSEGMAVVATRVGGLKDYGIPAKMRFLDRGDPTEIADAIVALMDNPSHLATMRQASLATIQHFFSASNVEQRYAAFARDIASLARR